MLEHIGITDTTLTRTTTDLSSAATIKSYYSCQQVIIIMALQYEKFEI